MTGIDTAALRADAEAMRLAGGLRIDLTTATVRALCDGYDEAKRLREVLDTTIARADDMHESMVRQRDAALAEAARLREDLTTALRGLDAYVGANGASVEERDAARQALADLVADLRALCDADLANDDTVGLVNDLRAVIDRHAPEGDA